MPNNIVVIFIVYNRMDEVTISIMSLISSLDSPIFMSAIIEIQQNNIGIFGCFFFLLCQLFFHTNWMLSTATRGWAVSIFPASALIILASRISEYTDSFGCFGCRLLISLFFFVCFTFWTSKLITMLNISDSITHCYLPSRI